MIGSHNEKLQKARRGLWRTALFWNPLFVITGGAAFYFSILQIATDNGVGWIIPVLLFLFSALLGFQGIQALRDLRGGTATTAGYITRRWWRLDLGTRSHYLRLDRNTILRIDRVQYLTVDKEDYVEVEYFPASMVAVSVEKKQPPENVGPSEEETEPNLPEPDPLLIERD